MAAEPSHTCVCSFFKRGKCFLDTADYLQLAVAIMQHSFIAGFLNKLVKNMLNLCLQSRVLQLSNNSSAYCKCFL